MKVEKKEKDSMENPLTCTNGEELFSPPKVLASDHKGGKESLPTVLGSLSIKDAKGCGDIATTYKFLDIFMKSFGVDFTDQ